MLNFVFLSTTDWDAPQFGSRQQIALRLARRGHQVLFVEVPRALHSLISAPQTTFRTLRRMGRARRLGDRLFAYTPPPVLPVYYHPLTNALNQRLLLRYVRRALTDLGWRADVLWTYWPHLSYLVGRLHERLAVYHCIDDFGAVSYPLVAAGTIARMEADLCRRVDLIFARTEGLAEDKRQYNPNTHFLPGGVDLALFDPARAGSPARDVAALPCPRIGLVGTLDDRLDVDLLVECARALPQVSLVFVGSVKRHRVDLTRLAKQPNVYLLPARPHAQVPSVVTGLDVCLIPYRANAYTAGLSPLKLYEYLALGKPVVATDLPYVRREADHICLARTPGEFLRGVQDALARPPSADERSRWRAVAETYSWDHQVDLIESQLARRLERGT